MSVARLDLPTPPMGGKCWVLDDKGIFVLETGPGVLRTIACTHAGAGSLEAFDGIPNDDGFFPDRELLEEDDLWWARNGRPIYRANPVVMGSWMLDGGFMHGLTIFASGGRDAVNAIASVVWMPFKAAKKK